MTETSRSPRIPPAPGVGDMLIGPDSVRIVGDGWVECGYAECEWTMFGGSLEDQSKALRDHTRDEHPVDTWEHACRRGTATYRLPLGVDCEECGLGTLHGG